MKFLRLLLVTLMALTISATPVLASPHDYCANIDGIQKKIPDGMMIEFHVKQFGVPYCVPAYPLE